MRPNNLLVAIVFLAVSNALAGCASGAPSDVAAPEEPELRGDVSYVRRLSEIAGPTFALEGTEFEGATAPVALRAFPEALRTRLEREVRANSESSDPERPHRVAEIMTTHEIMRAGRVVGRLAQLGISESRTPPWSGGEDAAAPEPSFGVWFYFDEQNRLVNEIEWEE